MLETAHLENTGIMKCHVWLLMPEYLRLFCSLVTFLPFSAYIYIFSLHLWTSADFECLHILTSCWVMFRILGCWTVSVCFFAWLLISHIPPPLHTHIKNNCLASQEWITLLNWCISQKEEIYVYEIYEFIFSILIVFYYYYCFTGTPKLNVTFCMTVQYSLRQIRSPPLTISSNWKRTHGNWKLEV